MSLYPHSDQIEYPSEPSSQRTRLLTSDSILLNSLTSISDVLSVTVIYTKSICSVITIRPPVFQCLINPTMSSSYLITCSANPIDPSEHSKNNLNLHIIFSGLSKPLTILFLFLLTNFLVNFHNLFSLSLPILSQIENLLSSFFCAFCKIIWIFF